MNKLNYVDIVALILLIVGGLNWGFLGLFQFDLVSAIFGVMSGLTRFIYIVVSIAALYGIYLIFKLQDTTAVKSPIKNKI